MTFAPRRVAGKPVRTTNIDGLLLAFRDGQPVLLRIPESSKWYLALFVDASDLIETMARLGAPHDRIKVIDDGPEFFSSIPADIEVITNLRWHEDGRLLFLQLLRP